MRRDSNSRRRRRRVFALVFVIYVRRFYVSGIFARTLTSRTP